MVFARRQRLPLHKRIGNLIWPRGGFRRGATYVGYRLIRLPGTPHAIATGFAWGAAISFTPFMGFHLAGAALGAWLMRGSIVASAIGTVVGNPWTFPFIWAWIYTCGTWILGGDVDRVPPLRGLERLFQGLWDRAGDLLGAILGFADSGAAPAVSEADMLHLAGDVLLPMVVGGLPNAVLAGLAFYFPVRRVVAAYQHRRAGRGHWRRDRGKAN